MEAKQNLKLLVTSDLHLSPRIWRHREILHDSYFAWECIVDGAITEQVAAVVLAGDILDKQSNPSEVIAYLLQGLARLRAAGIKVLYVQGQHEMQAKPWMSLGETELDSVIWLHNRQIELQGWRLAGLDFQPTAELQEFLRSPAATSADVLVCHQVWYDLMGAMAVTQGSFTDLPPDLPLLVTGDYHVHCTRHRDRTKILSPGSTHLRSISEPPEKALFVVELVPDEEPRVVSLELPCRKFVMLDLLGIAAEETGQPATMAATKSLLMERLQTAEQAAIADELPELLMKPILYFKYFRSAAELVNELARYVEDRAHIFYRAIPEDETSLAASAREHTTASTSLMAKLPDYLDPTEDKERFRLAVNLLQAEDPLLYLEEWLDGDTHED